MFEVADVAGGAAAMAEAVAGGALGMLERDGVDHRAVREGQALAGLEPVMHEAGGEHVEGDREERRREQPVEGLGRARPVEVAAPGVDLAGRVQHRRLHERQAADMVEVEVAQQQVDPLGQPVAMMDAEGVDAGAGIDHEQPLAAANFHAGGMPAEFHEFRTGGAGRPPDAPEPERQAGFHERTPRCHAGDRDGVSGGWMCDDAHGGCSGRSVRQDTRLGCAREMCLTNDERKTKVPPDGLICR